jgi:hypothetical protein
MSGQEIEYGEFWLPGGNDAHPDNPLAVCGACSAIVLDQFAHSRWHADGGSERPGLTNRVKDVVKQLNARRDVAADAGGRSGDAMARVYDDHSATLASMLREVANLRDSAAEQELGALLAGVLGRWEMQLAWKGRSEEEQAKAQAYRYGIGVVRELLAELDKAEGRG